MGRRILWKIIVIGSAIYLLNPGLGIFELIPDNLPFIGNIDEVGALMILLRGLAEIGVIPQEKIEKLLSIGGEVKKIKK
ncbi:MAG: DUF1232 domain-containing protein [Candidatus Altiarchaeota archaeon]